MVKEITTTRHALAWCGLLFATSFGLRWLMLSQSPIATGVDGYYFAEQARFLAEHGRFRSFENSIVVVLFGIIQKLIGNPIVAVKLGICFLAGLAAPAGFLFGEKSAGHWRGGLLLGSFLAVSPSFSLLCAQYPKTAGSIVFLFLALAALQRGLSSIQAGNKRAWLLLFGIFFLGLASSHKLVFVIGAWISGGIYLDHSAGFRRVRWWKLGTAIAGFAGLLLVMKVLLPSDLARLLPALSWPQGWPLRVLSERVFLHPVLKGEVILSLLSVVPGCVLLWSREHDRFQTVFWLLLIPSLFNPFLNYRVLDLGYRLTLVSFLPGIVLWSRWASARWGRVACGFAICGVFAFNTGRVYDPQLDERNAESYQEIVDRMPKNEFPLVICHLGLNYYYTWATGKDTLAFIPDDSVYPPEDTWRLSWGVSRDAYDAVLPLIEHDGLPEVRMLTTDYALIREDVWRLFRERMPPRTFLESLTTSWRNPHAPRPKFILKRSIPNRP